MNIAKVLTVALVLAAGLAVNTADAGAFTKGREGVNPFTKSREGVNPSAAEELASEGCVTTPRPVTDPRWAMTVTDGTIRLAATAAGTRTLTTTSVQHGGAPVGLAVTHATIAAGGATVTTTRAGLVEAAQSRPDGVEQAWCFPKFPDGSGDLVVRVAASMTANGETGSTTAEATADGITLQTPGSTTTYDNGTWLDAAGHTAPVTARYVNGAIELTVPAAVLATTTFPAVLDPKIVVIPQNN
jgi:hypothetical protein